jgi:hypothetical protein
MAPPWIVLAETGFSDSTNPDERGMLFQVPVPCEVDAMIWTGAIAGATSDFTMTLYSDPLGTPTALASVAILAEQLSDTTNGATIVNIPSEIALADNTTYCVAVKATGAGNISPITGVFSNESYRVFVPGGTTLAKATRNNGAGAFTAESPAVTMYGIGVRMSAFNPNAQSHSRMLLGAGL